MKILCAWCRNTLGFKCPQCGEILIPDPDHEGWMLCPTGPTRQRFTASAIARMVETHGICDKCADELTALRKAEGRMTDEDRANLAPKGEN